MIGLLLVGCGPEPAPQAVAPPPEESNKALQDRELSTGQGELLQRDEQLASIWTASYERADVTVSGEGRLAGKLFGVSGELFEAGEVASTYEANEADADQATNRLVLRDAVRVKSAKADAELRADTVEWLDAEGVIQASGNVEIRDGFGVLRSQEPIWVTPDLSRFGTPGMLRMEDAS